MTIKNRYKYIDEANQHLHILDGQPLIGTSSVGNVLAKPLTWWSAELAAVECLESGEKIPTIRSEYQLACESSDKKGAIDKLQKKYPIFKKARFAHFTDKKDKADKGVDLHAVLESFCKGLPLSAKELKLIDSFVQWSKENVKRFIASEGHCYSEKLWTGGIVDLLYEDNDGKFAIMDFKSSKEAYLSQFFQCAGYDWAISENGVLDKDGNQLYKLEKPISYYAVFPFGAENPAPQFYYDIAGGRKAFEAEVLLYKATNV